MTGADDTAPARNQVDIQALAVADSILEELATRSPLSAAELARSTGMTPPRVWRYLNSLEAMGYISSHQSRGFVLGQKFARFGAKALDQISLTELARPYLVNLRDKLGETVYLAVPGEEGAVVVASVNAVGPISLQVALGTIFTWTGSASGRVIAAYRSSMFQDQLYERIGEGHDPLFQAEELKERLNTIRQRRYDTVLSEQARRTTGSFFINAIATAVFDHANDIAGSVGILTGIQDKEMVSAPEIRGPLFDCAAGISRELSATAWDHWSPTQRSRE